MGRFHTHMITGPHKAAPAEGDAGEKAVLVVEADPEQQVLLAHALRARRHQVVAASSASGASALVAQWHVDLVLVSQELPGTTGIDVIRTLLQSRPELRVVLLTDEGSPGLYTAARQVGAHDCISRLHVAEALGAWLSKRGRQPAAMVTSELEADWEPAAQIAE